MSHSSRPLRKGKRGRGYPQPAEASKRASSSLEKDTTPKEAPAEEGWWRDPSNAEKEGGYMGPVNNKEKPSGTGTTTEARRKRRLGKQWDALEKAGAAYRPDSEECVDTHIDQLHKALQKAKERKEQLRGTSPSSGGVSSSSSNTPEWRRPTGPSRPLSSRGRRTLEKVQEENAQEARVLRQRSLSRGKTGPKMGVEASKKAQERTLKPRRLPSLEKLRQIRPSGQEQAQIKSKTQIQRGAGGLGKGYSWL